MKSSNEKTIYTLDSIIKFGQFKPWRWSVRQCIDKEPKVIQWYCDNIEWFVLDRDAQEFLDETLEPLEK